MQVSLSHGNYPNCEAGSEECSEHAEVTIKMREGYPDIRSKPNCRHEKSTRRCFFLNQVYRQTAEETQS